MPEPLSIIEALRNAQEAISQADDKSLTPELVSAKLSVAYAWLSFVEALKNIMKDADLR